MKKIEKIKPGRAGMPRLRPKHGPVIGPGRHGLVHYVLCWVLAEPNLCQVSGRPASPDRQDMFTCGVRGPAATPAESQS
jgi:hypothetical protein